MIAKPQDSISSEALAASRLAAIVDSSFDAIISKDLNSVITTWNNAAEVLFGYTAAEAVGQSILMLIPEERRSEEDQIIGRIRNGERVDSFETIRQRKDGTKIAVSITVSPIKNGRGRIIGASKIARDITAAKESERRIRVLLHEVNHRVKNQFSVIISILGETARRTTDPEEFVPSVRQRIMALAKSHDLLVDSDWMGAKIEDVVVEHLRAFVHEDKVTTEGPQLTLHANAVQNIGMALHELATNSTKYGALSKLGGSIAIDWAIEQGTLGEPEFRLTWDEQCEAAPPAEPEAKQHKGFGNIVLLRVTPRSLGGEASLHREHGRVTWTLTAPIATIVAS